MVERRRVLSTVQDSSSLMGMQYQMKARASQTRLEAHEETEQTVKVWSTKIDRRSLMSGSDKDRKENNYKVT